MHRFSCGSSKTLRDAPEVAGTDIRAELLRFHDRYYSANLMRLVVLGRASLDELQRMVEEKFSWVRGGPSRRENLDDASDHRRDDLLTQDAPLRAHKLSHCVRGVVRTTDPAG